MILHHFSCFKNDLYLSSFIVLFDYLIIYISRKIASLQKKEHFKHNIMKLYLFSISILKKNLILLFDFFIDEIRPSLSIIILLHSFCCLDPPFFIHYMCAYILLFCCLDPPVFIHYMFAFILLLRSARLYPLYLCIIFVI